MRTVIALFIIGLVYLSCSNETRGEIGAATTTPTLHLADTVDIPKDDIESPSMQRYFAGLLKKLNFSPLEGGSEGAQIRIWLSCNPKDTQQVMLFKQVASVWEAKFYTYQINGKEDGSFELYNVHSESKQPKSGWESFARKLLQSQIKDLPDYSVFGSTYNLPTDANGLAVEVATKNKYRRYYYPELWLNRKLAGGPEKLYSAIEMIEKEFEVKIYCL